MRSVTSRTDLTLLLEDRFMHEQNLFYGTIKYFF